jgi:hypothetical protein
MSTNKTEYPRDQVVSILKEWASPVLIGLVGMLLWRDITEMRSDVKLLLMQQSADRVKIEQLEDDVKLLKTYVLIPQSSSIPNPSENLQDKSPAILKDEEYDLKRKRQK